MSLRTVGFISVESTNDSIKLCPKPLGSSRGDDFDEGDSLPPRLTHGALRT